MEFNYSDYIVRITLNPNDIIIRFEHRDTFRSYEQTFFERDFPEITVFGGLEFLGKALCWAFQTSKEVNIQHMKESPAKISFQLAIENPLFIRPIFLSFELSALRKESGNLDMNVLNRKVKEMNDSLEPRLKQLQEALEGRLAIVDKLNSRISELEDRCGSSITLPGCIFAIPTNLTSLVLIRNQTSLPDGRAFATMMPGYSTSGQYQNSPVNWPSLFMGTQQIGYAVSWTPVQDAFAFDKLSSISNLKHLKQCRQLTLSGTAELADYSALGEMPWLTHLTIVSSRQYQNSPPNNWINMGNNPPLRDISWVKNLKSLQNLTLLGCNQLTDITPLKDLSNLRELDIRETGVRNTDFLVNPNLKITK